MTTFQGDSDTPLVTVVLIDDHMFTRKGIRAMLETASDIVVVGEAATYDAALAVIEKQKPQVVILDLQMPDANGAEICWKASQLSPHSAVLILTAFLNPQLLRNCLTAGAQGYLLKDTQNLDIVAAVRTVAGGGTVFDKRATNLERKIFGDSRHVFESLSPKELQILSLLCQGLTNNEIATELNLTLNTIKTHIKAIMRKLDCRNRVEIVLRARELVLI